jgi:hypothetical protein
MSKRDKKMSRVPQLSKTGRMIILAILIFGFATGAFVIAPNYTEDIFSKLFFGMLTGLALIYLTTPELMKFLLDSVFQRNLSQSQKDRKKKANKLRFWRSLTHPTTIFTSIAIAIWIAIALLIILFKLEPTDGVYLIFMYTLSLSFSLSGILMIAREEAIGRHGELIHGFRAVLQGIVMLILGVGFLLVAIKLSAFQ